MVLRCLRDAEGQTYGQHIVTATGLDRSTVARALRRFEDRGLVEGWWESLEAKPSSRPARLYYELTELGACTAEAVLQS